MLTKIKIFVNRIIFLRIFVLLKIVYDENYKVTIRQNKGWRHVRSITPLRRR